MIGTIRVLVRLYNAATSVEVIADDAEISTSDDVSFVVNLASDLVDTTNYVNSRLIRLDGELIVEVQPNDGIQASLGSFQGIHYV